jgi:chromosome segregation ATPase
LAKHEVEDFEARIKKKESSSQGTNPEVARLRDAVQKHTTLIANLRRHKPKCEKDIADAEIALAKAEAEDKVATEARIKATSDEQDMAVKIESLKSQSGSRLNAFGIRIDLVMREIDKARWVAGKPIGPLGMYVSLNDPRYKNVFHAVLGQTLCLFAVLGDADRATMMAILQRCQRQ